MYFNTRFALNDQSHMLLALFFKTAFMYKSCVAPSLHSRFEYSCEAKVLPSRGFEHGPKMFFFFF